MFGRDVRPDPDEREWATEETEGSSRRRSVLIAGAGAGLALVLVGGFVFVQAHDTSAEEQADAPVALSPDGLSANVSDAEVAAGEGIAAQALAGTLAAPAGAKADIPVASQIAYRRAEATLTLESPSCRLPWWALAGIGQVESEHASGRTVDAEGNVSPPLRGPRLDGSVVDTRMVLDTDRGTYDGDQQYDRAMGTFQMLAGTWRLSGRDGNGDGTVSPDNLYDAALSSASYLCSAGADLSTPKGLAATVLRYNNRPSYLADVLAWGTYYQQNLTPAPQLPAPTSNATIPPMPGPTIPVTTPPDVPQPTVPSSGPTPPPGQRGTTVPPGPGTTDDPEKPETPPVPDDPADGPADEPVPSDSTSTRSSGPSSPTRTRSTPPRTSDDPVPSRPTSDEPSRTVTDEPRSTRTREDPEPTRTREDPAPTRTREDPSPSQERSTESSTSSSTRRSTETADDVPSPTGSDLPAIPDDETPGSSGTATTDSGAR